MLVVLYRIFRGEVIVMTGPKVSTMKLTLLEFQLPSVSLAYTIILFCPCVETVTVVFAEIVSGDPKLTLAAPFKLYRQVEIVLFAVTFKEMLVVL